MCVRRCITRSTSYNTLCRDAGAVCNILQFSHSSGLIALEHQLCEIECVFVCASVRLCMMCVVMYVSMWEAGHGGLQKVCLPRARVCASERAR